MVRSILLRVLGSKTIEWELLCNWPSKNYNQLEGVFASRAAAEPYDGVIQGGGPFAFLRI